MTELAIVTFALILVRTATLIAVFPMFAGKNLPNLVKVGFAMALSVMWFTVIEGEPTTASALNAAPSTSAVWWSLAVLREVVVGGTLGVTLGLFLLPVQIAGAYIAQEMGLTMATLADPASGAQVSVWSQIMSSLGTLLFFGLDLHHAVLRALALSFRTRPVGGDWPMPSPTRVLAGIADAHEAGLMIAAPVGIGLFVTLIAVLLTMRVAHQFNLFSFGLAIRLGIGLMAALVFLPETCVLISRMYVRMGTLLVQ